MIPKLKISWRLKWILAIGLVLIVAAALYINYRFYLPVGSGPAGPRVAREPFAKAWSQRKVLLVGIGDSVTAGFGASKGKSYFERLVENPPDEFEDLQGCSLSRVLSNLEVRNIAISGSNSLQHLEYIEQLETQPDDVFGIVVMTSGGNDLIHWYGQRPPREGAMYGASFAEAQPWIANYEQRLGKMLDAITERFPGGCLIYLADIYDPSDGLGDPESVWMPPWPEAMKIHAAYNGVIGRCAAARQNVRLVPMHREFLGHGIHCRQFWREHYRADDPHYWYAWNLEDPNDRGYDAIRRLFLLEIVKDAERIGAGKPD